MLGSERLPAPARACSAGCSSISPGRPRIGPSSRASRPDDRDVKERTAKLQLVRRLAKATMASAVPKRPSIWKMALDAVWDGGPGTCHFAITSACNARCGFCSFARDRLAAEARRSVTLAEAKLACDILKRNGIRFLHFTGG